MDHRIEGWGMMNQEKDRSGGTGLSRLMRAAALAGALAVGACTDDGIVHTISGVEPGSGSGPGSGQDEEGLCSLNEELLWPILAPDAIPALTLPDMVSPESADASYLFDFDRVLGMVIEGEARAYPHRILWYHEIVNDLIGSTWVAVSFCPLTGSGLAFDPLVDGERLDLGVSGLLFANNLVMFDRLSGELYGPQLKVEGKCSIFRVTELDLLPVQEMSWGQWKDLHPDTKVVSDNTGFDRPYHSYPYGTYDLLASGDLLFPMSVDESRPIKERVLAIRIGAEGGRGYPFGALKELGHVSVVNEDVGGAPMVVFYSAANDEAALVFDARLGGQTLTFEVSNGQFVDQQSRSIWSIDGRAVSGPLVGQALQQNPDSYTLFWFAWRHFQPDGSTFTR